MSAWSKAKDTILELQVALETSRAKLVRAAEITELLETTYHFECEAGPLKNCVGWIELRKLLNDAVDR